MQAQTAPALFAEAQAIAAHLERHWNAGDGVALAEVFAPDADFVNVYGFYGQGREAIAKGHVHILTTVYAASTMRFEVDRVRLLGEDVAIAHLRSYLEVPRGPMAGSHQTRPSMVLTREGSRWRIAAFHNTFIKDAPTMP